MIYDAGDYELLNEYMLLLTKKHGQLRLAIVNLVDHLMKYLPNLSNTIKLNFINSLRTITEGKVGTRLTLTCFSY